MIKETVVTLAFATTLIKKHHQPDLPHKDYWPITESHDAIRVYGNMQVNQRANNRTDSYFTATLVNKYN